MKTRKPRAYVGFTSDDATYVIVMPLKMVNPESPVYGNRASEPYLLPPRRDLANHSATGFAWGYQGSGPAQLALAILADYLGDDERALALHQVFKSKMIATLVPDHSFAIMSHEIDPVLAQIDIDEHAVTGNG